MTPLHVEGSFLCKVLVLLHVNLYAHKVLYKTFLILDTI